MREKLKYTGRAWSKTMPCPWDRWHSERTELMLHHVHSPHQSVVCCKVLWTAIPIFPFQVTGKCDASNELSMKPREHQSKHRSPNAVHAKSQHTMSTWPFHACPFFEFFFTLPRGILDEDSQNAIFLEMTVSQLFLWYSPVIWKFKHQILEGQIELFGRSLCG